MNNQIEQENPTTEILGQITQDDLDRINGRGTPLGRYLEFHSIIDKKVREAAQQSPHIDNQTRVESGSVINIAEDKFYIMMHLDAPLEHLIGQDILPENVTERVQCDMLVVNPKESLLGMSDIEAGYAEIDNLLEGVPREELDHDSKIVFDFLKRKVEEETKSWLLFGRDNGLGQLSEGIDAMPLDDESKQKLKQLSKNMLKISRPWSYDRSGFAGEQSVLSALISGECPKSTGLGLRTPVYANLIHPVIGLELEENIVRNIYLEKMRSLDRKRILIISGHGGSGEDEDYLVGENFSQGNQSLQEVLELISPEKYDLIIIAACNGEGLDLARIDGINIPLFYVDGVVGGTSSMLFYESTHVMYDPVGQQEVRYAPDAHKLMGVRIGEDEKYEKI